MPTNRMMAPTTVRFRVFCCICRVSDVEAATDLIVVAVLEGSVRIWWADACVRIVRFPVASQACHRMLLIALATA